MTNIPTYLSVFFIATVILTIFFISKSARNAWPLLMGILTWLIAQGVIALSGFYTDTTSMPPRMAAMLFPPLLCIVLLFSTQKGRVLIDQLDTTWLYALHIVRIPVELVLFFLFKEGQVPQLMTFEGINFDMLSGITAPLIVYFGCRKNRLGKPILLIWNIICLALLFNVAYHGILSVPTPFQRFGFEQPNIGLTYFPYVFLPGFIVPAVLFAHLVSIRKLIYYK